jgi:hypothetical protein
MTTKYFETIYDITTGKTTKRDYTLEEVAVLEAVQAANAEIQSVKQAQAEANATAKAALLARLGITADEAKLLLG